MKASAASRAKGFTLIELLAVMVIMSILAGLVVAGVGMVKNKEANAKAEIQVKLLGKALEEYKLDKGNYPVAENASGSGTTDVLYRALYQDGVNNNTKIYLPELQPGNKQGWVKQGQERIFDPWKNEYRYRTGESANNPDFDLWSAGKDGKTNASNSKSVENNDDIKN